MQHTKRRACSEGFKEVFGLSAALGSHLRYYEWSNEMLVGIEEVFVVVLWMHAIHATTMAEWKTKPSHGGRTARTQYTERQWLNDTRRPLGYHTMLVNMGL